VNNPDELETLKVTISGSDVMTKGAMATVMAVEPSIRVVLEEQ